ncbi:hypothetical protein [Thalassospira sp. MCCC 1A01428]|uniref:hypothetical protein n=1 Tax=Thalassospira sp. MCCC 1A01428 TaxID=1470575 RepID=UPI000A1DE460|nr:hypothetical protein [Thalassospira sp. MCCC 1A01428]OSQ43281.1 hypothetical protein THS27_11370 [Thalassospira sp. MCCC 1A01428]
MGEVLGGPYSAVPDWPGRDASNVGHARITAFLVLDIQQSREKAEYVRDRIINQPVRAGQSGAEDDIVMNAYSVTIGPETSVIEPAIDDTGEDPVVVRTPDLLAALERRIADIDTIRLAQ